jgi:hypothetical protein
MASPFSRLATKWLAANLAVLTLLAISGEIDRGVLAQESSTEIETTQKAWYDLFDGKSWRGWEEDRKEFWRIENDALVAGSLDKRFPRNEFLCTIDDFGDFELQLQYRIEGTEGFVNGGVQFRSQRIADHHEMTGYQADLGAGYDGSLYDESRRNKFLAQADPQVLQQALKKDDWNQYRIRAQGDRIQLWLNEVQTVDYRETDPSIPRTGRIAVQIHGDGVTKVQFRHLQLRKLPTAPSP